MLFGVSKLNILRKAFLACAPAVAAMGAIAMPTSASALTVVEPCDAALVSPNATDCSGYYAGNLLGGSAQQIADQAAAIGALDASYVFDGNWAPVDATKLTADDGDTPFDFGQMLYGETIIAAHFGNVAGPAGNVTAFYVFDFGTEGVRMVTLNNTQGWSNAVLYTTGAVPEPAMWMMMILGFGGIGFVMRRRKEIAGKPAVA